MCHPAKRNASLLSPEELSKGVSGNPDGQPEKKGKWGDRLEPPTTLPTGTRYLPLILGGLHWRGKKSFENVVVFGDSYSKSSEVGDDEEPRTWVECLLGGSHIVSPIHVYNFAFPGATAEDDLPRQFSRFKESLRGLSLDGEHTTYFFYLGINDCGRTLSDDLEPIAEAIFDVLHDLYTKFFARNFVLIDVPPIDRSPGAVESDSADDIKERVHAWNELLRSQANDFAKENNMATVFIFSSHHLLTEVLDDPLDFDFTEDDPETEGAGIWADDLHLTSAVHSIFAERLLDSLIDS